mgnify:CR=1 FL=1
MGFPGIEPSGNVTFCIYTRGDPANRVIAKVMNIAMVNNFFIDFSSYYFEVLRLLGIDLVAGHVDSP